MAIRAILLVACLLPFAVSMRPEAGAAQSATESPTFSETIAGIVYDNCVECHRAGGPAPFPLVSYEDDRLHATEMKLHARAIEHEQALKLASEARLAALEARVHPHFLFNTLNTISSLIPEAPERAERLVERMAAVLRFSLDGHDGKLVPLEQEMTIVRDYLEIERARFGDRLRYALEVDSDFHPLLVPPFAVQTLVENSVKFAVAPERNGGEVRVRARREGRHVRLQVADTGPGFSIDDISAGHGLDNLRGRLALTFGAPEPLRLDRRDGWTTVSFQVPG